MINLIPPQAKRTIIREYWMRVVSVWMLLIAATLLAVIALTVPTYVLVTAQLSSLTEATQSHAKDISTLKEAETQVERANDVAKLLTEDVITVHSHTLAHELEKLSGKEVTFVGFSMTRNRIEFTELSVEGVAENRVALVAYRDAITNHELFETAELPISNFAEKEDIEFTMQVTIKSDDV